MRRLHIFLKKSYAKSTYRLLAQIALISFIISSTLSCASEPPSRLAVKKDQLSKYNVVSLHVSSEGLDVKYSREGSDLHAGTKPLALASVLIPTAVTGVLSVSPLGMVITSIADALIKSSEDSERTQGARKEFDDDYFEKLLGDYFLENIREAKSFNINFSQHKSYKELKDEGSNALIELNIDEICLKKAGMTNRLNLYVHVLGKMVDLENETVIWSQDEVFMSDEEHTLDEYKADEAIILRNLLNKAFRKVAYRLSCNIIYSK